MTEQVKQCVYVYLIDSGVYGSERIISDYISNIGRDIPELKGIFLTHSHPDHIGAAAQPKTMTNCRIYASKGERCWIENIDLEYRKRPIPNFYQLAGTASVKVDQILSHRETVSLEPNLQIEVISTGGHSMDDISYLLREPGVLFPGDAISVPGDIPIYIDSQKSLKSLNLLYKLSDAMQFFVLHGIRLISDVKISRAVENGIRLIESLECNINCFIQENLNLTAEQYTALLCEKMQTPQYLNNPLFKRTVISHIYL